MARPRVVHRCSACGATSAQWSGRCGTCDEWNTLVAETVAAPAASGSSALRSLAGTSRSAGFAGLGRSGGSPSGASPSGASPSGGSRSAGSRSAGSRSAGWRSPNGPEADGPGIDSPDRFGGIGGAISDSLAEDLLSALVSDPAALRLGALDSTVSEARPTGLEELDRVLGGGLVPGSVTLVGGEPGIGKSTLLLQTLASLAAGGTRVLLVSAEESPEQVKRRAERLGCPDNLWVVGATSLPGIGAALEQVRPEVVVVDSIQTVWDPSNDAPPGSVTQVRSCAGALTLLAKRTGLTVVLVGHVTKDGGLAGPRTLEHLVDTVLSFEGDRHHALRLLRAVKHRFGPTGELGVFEMAEEGLRGVADASGLFLGDRSLSEPGSTVFPSVEGVRPVLIEIQALVAPGTGAARRSGIGIDGARLGLLAAVLDRRAAVAIGGSDIYASAAGGARVSEPGADLAICLAVASAAMDIAVPSDMVVIGEVGLAGELRQATHTPRRIAEAARLGFRRVVVPASSGEGSTIDLVRVATLGAAVDAVLGPIRCIRDDLRRAAGAGRTQ